MTITPVTRYEILTADKINELIDVANAYVQFDVKSFGAIGDGIVDDRIAIQAAIDAASASTFGGVVTFPPGLYRINRAVGGLVAKSNVTLRGTAPNVSTIWCDDATGENGYGCLYNVTTWPNFTTLTNFRLESLGFKGRADVSPTSAAGQLVVIGNCDDLRITNCWFTYSRLMGCVIGRSRRVTITGCYFRQTIADGANILDCSDTLIHGNTFYRCNDDAIGVHTDDLTTEPVRSNVVISNNNISDSQGIACLGAKNIEITNNALHRIMLCGIRIRSSTLETTGGQTSQFSCKIVNNIINDVILRSEPSPRGTAHYGIWIGGGPRDSGSAASPPGEPTVGTGAVPSLYGASGGVGTLYKQDTALAGVPQIAGFGIEIRDNIVMRTLPAVTNVSEWGYSSEGLWVGNNGDGSGYYNGTITDAALSPSAIMIDPALWECRISGNILAHGGLYGIEFRNAIVVANLDYRGLTISDNKIIDFQTYGILTPPTSTFHRMIIRDNEFDGDPFFRSANRGANGTWLANTTPHGIYANVSGGMIMHRNHFRNVANTITYGSGLSQAISLRDNYQYGEAVAVTFSTSNKGVGNMAPNGLNGWITIPENSDPTLANYGQLSQEVVVARSAMPTVGSYTRGHVVWNTNPVQSAGKVLIGWARLTTGAAHVLNTDWSALYVTTT
jgi:hypothetical protein